jgi:hypothetical protein
MGKLTISMAIFNSYVSLPEGTAIEVPLLWKAACPMELSPAWLQRLQRVCPGPVYPGRFVENCAASSSVNYV